MLYLFHSLIFEKKCSFLIFYLFYKNLCCTCRIQKALKKGDLPSIPNPDQVADMYEMAVTLTKEHGFRHYEVSNYSRSTTTMSQHNFSYWRGMDYIGIGPGAHGKITHNHKSVRTYGVINKNEI